MKAILSYSLCLLFLLSAAGQEGTKTKANSKAFGITASLPYINGYHYYDYDMGKAASKAGFVGMGLAIFYKHNKNKLSLNYGFTADLPAPIGPIDYAHQGTRSRIGSTVIDLFYHRKIYWRFNLIGGLTMTKYRYNLISYVNTLPSFQKWDYNLGMSTGIEYASERSFSLAFLYRPAIISFDTKQYKHLLTIDFCFDISFWKR